MFSDPLIPMYYMVPEDTLNLERNEPGKQIKIASKIGFEEDLYLWNQAMFVIAQLLTANLLHINELDPIRRYLPSFNRPRKGGRYSAFQACTIYILSHFQTLFKTTKEII